MSATDLAADVAQMLSEHLGSEARVGVAVSGGGDSVALAHWACAWARATGAHPEIATVDHGLRAGSQDEALGVADLAAALEVPHKLLTWRGWDGRGNLQDKARSARHDLLLEWARSRNLDAILLGHTQDDQAETFLLNLARGSGVDGLAGMPERQEAGGLIWLRPMLGMTRAEVRGWLTARDLTWVDDPSNEDERFERVRWRKAADQLAQLGLTHARLAATADAMQRARQALSARALSCGETLVTMPVHGVLRFDFPGLAALEEETRFRLLSHALKWTSSQPYRPRLNSLQAVWHAMQQQQTATLHGCVLVPWRDALFVAREHAAVAEHDVPEAELWDHRWCLSSPDGNARVAPLAEAGLRQLETRPDTVPYPALFSLPALWDEGAVVGVPALSWGVSGRSYTFPSKASFLSGLIPH